MKNFLSILVFGLVLGLVFGSALGMLSSSAYGDANNPTDLACDRKEAEVGGFYMRNRECTSSNRAGCNAFSRRVLVDGPALRQGDKHTSN